MHSHTLSHEPWCDVSQAWTLVRSSHPSVGPSMPSCRTFPTRATPSFMTQKAPIHRTTDSLAQLV